MNWSGIGSDGGGTFYVVTGTVGVATRLSINPSGGVRLWNYGAGALSSDGSGNISAGTLAVANGGTGTTASFGSGNVLLASAQSSNSSGYTWVGGVLIQWTTSANFAGGNTAAVTWPIAFPTGVFQVTATMGGANIAVGAGGTSTTGTTLTASANNSSTASVVAIGH